MGINKDQVEGRAKEAAGKVQEVAGKATGSTTQQVKGNINKNVGAAQAKFGDVWASAESPRPAQSTPIITFGALMMAYALAPALSPSFSADTLVMIDTISMPGASSIRTSVSTAPGVTRLIVAGRTLRALTFMIAPS
ncbi:MAG: CsbD family protein [Steroidobacteraceae bacterium]